MPRDFDLKLKSFSISSEKKKLLIYCVLFAFIWGLIAHGYGFMHSSFSHDVLNAVFADWAENIWKIKLGRPFAAIYRIVIRGGLALPWLIGLLSLIWISLSIFIISILFNIESPKSIAFLAGFCTVNITVIALTATYVYELDFDMFALLCACISVYLWNQNKAFSLISGALLTTITLGLYQSYISVSITLIMLLSVYYLLNDYPIKDIIIKGIKGIAMIAVGALLYFIMLKIIGYRLNTESYNSVYSVIDSESRYNLFGRIKSAYTVFFNSFFNSKVSFIGNYTFFANIIVSIVYLMSICLFLFDKKRNSMTKALLLLLVLFLPLGMNAAALFTDSSIHDLMKYSFWFFYIPIIVYPFRQINNNMNNINFSKIVQVFSTISLIAIMLENTVTANACYLKKELESEATLSLMTRITYSLEHFEGYVPGETEIAIVGVSDQINDNLYGFEKYSVITGMDSTCAIPKSYVEPQYNAYAAYFRYILNNPAKMCTTEKWNHLQIYNNEVKQMPVYPEIGFMKIIDDVLVIKLGNKFW